MATKKRLQFDFEDEAYQQLEAIEQTLRATSKAEVVRRALRLLDYTLACTQSGGMVVLRDPQGKEKTLVP